LISKVINTLYYEVLGISVDPGERIMETYKLIAGYDIRAETEPVWLENLKTIDIIASIASEIGVNEWEGRVGEIERYYSSGRINSI